MAALVSGLQIAVHEVDLLQTAKALADVLCPHISHPLDGFELCVGSRQDLVQAAEISDDGLDNKLWQSRNAPQDPVAARRHRMVERVELAVVAEQLGQATE